MKTGKLRRIMGLVLTLAMLLTMVALPTGALAARSYAATPTDDNSGAQNRNIERVIDSINGYTLVNGAQFSFNHAVGERSKERGYENATNGRGVKTYGGGGGSGCGDYLSGGQGHERHPHRRIEHLRRAL